MKIYRPDFLTSTDAPWIDQILELYRSFDGASIRALEQKFQTLILPHGKQRKIKRLRGFLDREFTLSLSGKSSRSARLEVFSQIFSQNEFPTLAKLNEIANAACKMHSLSSRSALEEILTADLLCHRRVAYRRDNPSADEVAAEVNLWFTKSLLRQASAVTVAMRGQVRRVIRTAKLKGLICHIRAQSGTDQCVVDISGPAVILFKTKIYGHGLASILGVLPWCDHFTLDAICRPKDESYVLQLKSGDPIKPSTKPKMFDSGLEQKFSRDFTRKIKDWTLVREPGPIETKHGIIFPDFLIHLQIEPEQRFYCEIVGWWTQEYLERKVKQWKSVTNEKFILCVDKGLGEKVNFNFHPDSICFFTKTIDVHEVMAKAGY